MKKKTTNSSTFNFQTGFILALLGGLILVFVINHFSRKGIEGLIKSEEEVVNYFELIRKTKQLQVAFLDADIHYHNYLIFGKKENLNLVKEDIKNAKALYIDLENDDNNLLEKLDASIQFHIQDFKTDGKELLEMYEQQFSGDTISEPDYEKIELLRDSVELNLTGLENHLQLTIVPNLEEKRTYGNWVILIDMISFFLTVLMVITAIWFYFNYAEEQKKLQKSLEAARLETEKTALIKEQFLTNTSHEIRTPLNAILGFSNLLKKEKLTSKQLELANGIDHSGNSLLAIINDILDFSKLDAGMMSLQSVPFNPCDLVQSVVQMFQPQVLEKQIGLKLFSGKNLPKVVVGDPTRLTQVLVNLINNAVKFTEEGKVEVHAHFVRQEGDICRLGFRIMDTGVGISKNKQTTIFERFIQGDAQLTRGKGGTGLGLAIVKKIIDLQNGKINVKSKIGEGSTFYFEIPYQYSEDKSIAKNEKQPIDISKIPQGIQLLVVEDNPMNRRVIELLLEDWKIDFVFAENGKIAIEKSAQQKFDLILMDIQLPEMDGYEVTQHLRNTLQIDTPIIAMTAHAVSGEKEKCVEAGMNDYLSKPFEEQDLIQLILKYIKKENTVSASETLLDLAYLKDISRGKPERIRELAKVFIEQAPKEISAIEKAMVNNDFDAIKSTVHSMKTTAGFMGLKKSLGKILAEMEEEATSNQLMEIIEKQFATLNNLTLQALEEIERTLLKS